MPKDKFLKIFKLYYDITDGKPQFDNRPDVKIELNSISSCLKISIFIHGYTTGDFPDYIYCLTNESSNDEFDRAISMLELCAKIVEISKKSFIK